jgi:hypothetical protein
MQVLGFQDKLLIQVSYLYPMYFINSLLLANKAKFGLFNLVGLKGTLSPPPPPPPQLLPFNIYAIRRGF